MVCWSRHRSSINAPPGSSRSQRHPSRVLYRIGSLALVTVHVEVRERACGLGRPRSFRALEDGAVDRSPAGRASCARRAGLCRGLGAAPRTDARETDRPSCGATWPSVALHVHTNSEPIRVSATQTAIGGDLCGLNDRRRVVRFAPDELERWLIASDASPVLARPRLVWAKGYRKCGG